MAAAWRPGLPHLLSLLELVQSLLSIASLRCRRWLARLVLASVFMAGAAVLIAPAAAQSATASAGAVLGLPAQPGYYRMRVGAVTVTALSDGTLPLTYDFLTHTTPAEVNQRLARAKVPYPVETSVNAYLLDTGTRLVLVDTGAGALMGPVLGAGLGRLPASLRAAGYQPAQVTDILLTHLHSDHIGGLTADDQRVFPNATVHVSQAESDYWLSDANLAKAPADGKVLALDRRFFLEARAQMAPYVAAGNVQPFAAHAEVVPGIRALATPGHTTYVLESQGQQLVFWGDLVHVAAVQLANPAVTFTSDVNAAAAVAERRQALADAARRGYWVAGDHLSFPGIGHVRAAGTRYEWLPVNYSTTGAGQ